MVALTITRVSLVTPIETDSSTIVFYEAEEGAALDCTFYHINGQQLELTLLSR
jgi:hypothetical protein